MARKFVCRCVDVPANGMAEFDAGEGLKVLIARSGEEYFACQATCPHQDVSLAEGLFDGSVLTCHQHLWQWNIRSGSPIGLAELPLDCFRVEVDDESIYIDTPGALDIGELFVGIAEATLAQINALAKREEYPQGGILYEVGDPAENFYVLESGRVEFLIGRDERIRPAGFMLRKGEVFGWAALLESQPVRIARASCLEKSTLLRINGPQAVKILEADPASGYVVMRRLSSLIARYLASSGAR